MVWWLSCVWAVCGMEEGHMGCVVELDVAGSGVAFGEWRLGVGPVWGLMVGVDAVVRQRWMLCVGLVGWLPVWCGRCIEAVLFVSVGVMV
jgi:hypothetical protein